MIKRIKKDKVNVTSGMIFPANATYEFILFHRPKVRHCPLDKGPILWSRVPRTFTWNLTSSNPGSARLHIRQNSGRQEKSSFKNWTCARIFRSSFLVSGERDKLFTWEKVVPPARVTLPAEVRQLAPCPSFRSPLPSFWDECTTSCKRLAEFCKDRSEKLVRPGRDHINRVSTSHLTKLP